MFVRHTGTGLRWAPVWAPEAAVAAAAPSGEAVTGNAPGNQPNGDGGAGDQPGSAAFNPETAYAELEADSRGWLQKNDALYKDPKALAKHAHNQEKLLGNAIRIPGKDATPEERDAYFTKLGRPKTAAEYKFTVPKDLPEGLTYDVARADKLKAALFERGLSQDHAQAVHDMYLAEQVEGHNAFKATTAEQRAATAKAEGEKLIKLWGPLDGATAQANLELADRALTLGGTDNTMVEVLKRLGVMGDDKVIYDAGAAQWFAKVGTALYTEDGVLRGQEDRIGNPFAEGKDHNLTKQMDLVKNDPDTARSLIAAAGKNPKDFFKS